jgi:hypothetical protein
MFVGISHSPHLFHGVLQRRIFAEALTGTRPVVVLLMTMWNKHANGFLC